MLSKTSQSEKAKNHMISFICGYETNLQTQTTVWWLPEGRELGGSKG